MAGIGRMPGDPKSIPNQMLERLARAAHQRFCDDLLARGYRLGPATDEATRTHSSLKPFDQLPPDEQEQNRDTVLEIPTKLAAVGLDIAPTGSGPPATLGADELERMAELEHERWMRAKLAAGWKYGPSTDKAARLHHNLVPWTELSDADREKDRVMVRAIPAILSLAGYQMRRAGPA
jgi:hypothetical protein